jgi:hypothetical protein
MGSLATGLAMGTGSAVAHTAINSLTGNRNY